MYKRQALYLSQMDEIDRKLRELRKLRRRLLEAAGEDRQIHDTERMMEYLEAVSYTHLDVYKRQEQSSFPAKPG